MEFAYVWVVNEVFRLAEWGVKGEINEIEAHKLMDNFP